MDMFNHRTPIASTVKFHKKQTILVIRPVSEMLDKGAQSLMQIPQKSLTFATKSPISHIIYKLICETSQYIPVLTY